MSTKAPTDVNPKLTDVKKALGPAIRELGEIADERKDLNERKRDILDALEEGHGLNRKAIQDAMRYAALPEGQKDGYDLSFQIAREVMGAPWQPDLFRQPKADDGEEPAEPAEPDAGRTEAMMH